MSRRRLGDMVVEAGLASEAQVRAALLSPKRTPLGRTLVAAGVLDERDLLRLLGQQLSLAIVDLTTERIDEAAIAKVPATVAWRLRAVPYRIEASKLHVAIADPTAFEARDALVAASLMDVVLSIDTLSSIEVVLEEHHGEDPNRQEDDVERMSRRIRELEREVRDLRRKLAGG